MTSEEFYQPNGGTWYQGHHDDDWVAAHEAGHLLGLPDQYAEVGVPGGPRQTQPKPGFEHNIMGGHGQPNVRGADIAAIIAANPDIFPLTDVKKWVESGEQKARKKP